MKETHRFFDAIRKDADNIYCFHGLGDLTVLVSSIGVEAQNVMVTLNPNITEYQRTTYPLYGGTVSQQSVGFEPRFRPSTLSCDNPADVRIDGKPFIIRPVSFGYANEGGGKRAYCDIEVEAVSI
jgi:hypothetical protein